MTKYIIFALIITPMTCFAGSVDSFFGTYQDYSRLCDGSFLIVEEARVSLGECKKLSYEAIEADEDQILIDAKASQACTRQIIKIARKKKALKAEGKVPRQDPPMFISFAVSTYQSYDKAKRNEFRNGGMNGMRQHMKSCAL